MYNKYAIHTHQSCDNIHIGGGIMNREVILNKDRTGDNIKEFIAKSGYTFEVIAEILGLASPRVIYDWINGFKLPSLNHLVKLSAIFNVKLEDILFIEDVF